MADQDNTQTQTQTQAQPTPAPAGGWTWGTGRRKTSVARVRVRPGTGQFLINKRAVDNYFKEESDRRTIAAVLAVGNLGAALDIFVSVAGGGSTGQAGAVAMGLARALARIHPETDRPMRDLNMLTRDARMKERKKYGQKGARKRFQFSKR